MFSALCGGLLLSSCRDDSEQTTTEPQNYQGEGAPNDSLGADGSTYLDTLTGDTYTKVNGEWVLDEETEDYIEVSGIPSDTIGNDGDQALDITTGDLYEKQNGKWVLIKEGDLIQKHTVTFDPDGGVWEDGSVLPKTVEVRHGYLLTQPIAPKKENANFKGWFLPDGSQWSFYSNTVLMDLTLTAEYTATEAQKLEITINPNNGEPSYTISDTFDGDNLNLKIPTYDGYDFLGWYVEGTEDRFTGVMRPEYNGVTLVARWAKAQFNFLFQVENDDTITITGLRNIDSVEIVIPSQVDGRTVARLSPSAFQNRIHLESVTLPSSLVEFTPKSFLGCRALKEILIEGTSSIIESRDGIIFSKGGAEILFVPPKNRTGTYTIPEGVTKIGSYAFYDQNSEGITNVEFNEGLTEIGDSAFYRNAFSSVTFPSTLKKIGVSAFSCISSGSIEIINFNEGLEEIGDSAFTGCWVKDTLTLPSTLKVLGEYAFANANAIEDVIIPKSLEVFGAGAFNGATGVMTVSVDPDNQYFVAVNDIVYTKDMTEVVYCPSGRRGDGSSYVTTLPSTIKKIRDRAFYMVDNCLEFVLNDGLEEIGVEAFSQCYDLPSIVIPDSVTTIGKDAFSYCDNLSEVTIGKGVELIPEYCFSDNISLTSINIPGNVKRIDDSAFFGCNLSSITLNEGIEEIGDGAFYFYPVYDDEGWTVGAEVSSLKSLSLPNSLKTIGDRAFNGHTELNTLHIGSGLESFNINAFYDAKLTTITIDSANEHLVYTNNIIYSKDYSTLYYANENVIGDLVIDSRVKTIGTYAFDHNKITTVNLSNVETIGEGAFNNASLTSVHIPSSVRTILDGAFYSNSDEDYNNTLTSVTFDEGVKTIGASAFGYCQAPTLDLPDSLEIIGESAFSMDSALTKLTFGSNLKEIGSNAFQNSQIEGVVTFPSSLEKIGSEVFYHINVSIPSKITDFVVESGNSHFTSENGMLLDIDKEIVYCYAAGNSQTSLTLPSTVKTLESYAFQKAVNLESLTLNEGLETIKEYALSRITNVKTLEVPSTVTYIENYAFSQMSITSTLKFNCTEEYAIKNFEQYYLSSCQATVTYLED